MVATAVRQTFATPEDGCRSCRQSHPMNVVTPEDGGRSCRKSHPMTVAFLSPCITVFYILQYTFMLSLEVMGSGGSLSMLLLLCHTGAGECPGRQQW
jgi:hypothetical protein